MADSYTRYRQDRARRNNFEKLYTLLPVVAGVGAVGWLFWNVAQVFEKLTDHLPF